MYLFPMVERELKVAVRRASTRWLRLAFGGGTMLATVWSFLVWGSSFASAGIYVFNTFCFIAAFGILCGAVVFASDGISRERRDGTLGFLYLTDLDALDVVTGKLASAAVVPLATLAAMFPGLALCQLLGGITPGDFWRAIITLLATLFFAFSGTLCVSAICEQRRHAVMGAVLLFSILNPLWLWPLAWFYSARPGLFWMATMGTAVLGALCLAAAVLLLRRSWHNLSKTVEKSIRGKQASARIRELLTNAPITWLMLRRRDAGWKGRWAAILGLSATFAWLLKRRFMGSNSTIEILFFVHIACLVVVFARTAYGFYTDRHDGSLELLLGTPLSNQEIFAGFSRFLFEQSALLLCLVSLVDLLLGALLWAGGVRGRAAFPIAFSLGLWFTFLGARWLGVYRSLMTNHPFLSVLGTFGRLLFVPIVLSLLFLAAPRTNLIKVASFWVLACGFLALCFGVNARRVLLERGRELLLRPHDEKPPHIESEWSFIDWSEVIEEQATPLPSAEPA
jgi:ABC-type transport system involved in cytochrome c biogenesis permease component